MTGQLTEIKDELKIPLLVGLPGAGKKTTIRKIVEFLNDGSSNLRFEVVKPDVAFREARGSSLEDPKYGALLLHYCNEILPSIVGGDEAKRVRTYWEDPSIRQDNGESYLTDYKNWLWPPERGSFDNKGNPVGPVGGSPENAESAFRALDLLVFEQTIKGFGNSENLIVVPNINATIPTSPDACKFIYKLDKYAAVLLQPPGNDLRVLAERAILQALKAQEEGKKIPLQRVVTLGLKAIDDLPSDVSTEEKVQAGVKAILTIYEQDYAARTPNYRDMVERTNGIICFPSKGESPEDIACKILKNTRFSKLYRAAGLSL